MTPTQITLAAIAALAAAGKVRRRQGSRSNAKQNLTPPRMEFIPTLNDLLEGHQDGRQLTATGGGGEYDEMLIEIYEKGRADARGSGWGPHNFDPPFGDLTEAFYRAGYDGSAAPSTEPVIGWRYGDLPEGGRSTNYKDGFDEAGVSMMGVMTDSLDAILHDPTKYQDNVSCPSMGTFFSDRPIEWVIGLLLEERGSDGEPLLVGAQPLSIWA
jgi:hypothetical protein